MSTTTPAVYVGTYHKYYCGSLAGKWFDLTKFNDEQDFLAACSELHADEEDPELMFQNWEGIPSGLASESHVNWAFIDAYRQAEAFVEWVWYFNACDYDAFQEAYQGGQKVRKSTHATLSMKLAYSLICRIHCWAISTMKRMGATCS